MGARRALRAGDWESARGAFAAFDDLDSTAEALDGWGLSLWWLNDPVAGIAARTRAYALFRRQGDLARAGRIAVWLAREYRILLRNNAVADGWLGRAQSMPRSVVDPSLSGWVRLAQSEALAPTAEAARQADEAVRIARMVDDRDLEIVSLSRRGAARVASGAVDDGLQDLNEALVAATSGEGQDPQYVGEALCTLMEVAGWLGDPGRVGPWAQVLVDFGAQFDFGPLLPYRPAATLDLVAAFCEACCGGVYLVTGRLDEAEQQLTAAVARMRESGLHPRCVHPVGELAELRIVQGRLEEAETLLAEYEDSEECILAVAALDLARNRPSAARARLTFALEQRRAEPVRSLPLWSALVDASLAEGDEQRAAQACAAVAEIAALSGSSLHEAAALFARGKVAAFTGDPGAVDPLRAASRQFAALSSPLLAGRARLALAGALVPLDRPLAITEGRSALLAFERMGASADADRAAGFLKSLGVKGRTGPRDVGVLSRRETEVLRLVSEGLSNAEIADRLVISVKTAGHHVSSILTKLGLRSRTEAAAFAVLNLPSPRGPAGLRPASK